MTKTSTNPLRLPVSLKAAVEELSKQDGTATFFEERRALGDREVLRRVVNRSGGEPPRAGDEADSPS